MADARPNIKVAAMAAHTKPTITTYSKSFLVVIWISVG